jgi:hypothetical protein
MGQYNTQYAYTGQRDNSHSVRNRSDDARFLPAMQNSMQFKTYGLFISGLFYLAFSNHSRLQVTKTMETKTTRKVGLLYLLCAASLSN